MELKNLKTTKVSSYYSKGDDEINIFALRCIFNDYFKEEYKLAENILEESKDTYDFVYKVLHCDDLKLTQGYAELSKTTQGHYTRLMNMINDLGRDVFHTDSDAGGLKIGNDDFSLIVPNGFGDGTTTVAVINELELNLHMVTYFTSVYGKFNIYGYDCGDDVVMTLEGKYSIYYQDTVVVLVKWD